MLMIELPGDASSIGSAACEARTIAITSTARPAAQPASSSPMPKPDALLTSTSMPPSAAACRGHVADHRGAVGEIADFGVRAQPAAAISARVLFSAAAPRAQIDTSAPAAAKPAQWRGRCRGCRR
jgi:hypothetical protein